MTRFAIRNEELWRPWYIEPVGSHDRRGGWTFHDLPDELVLRFQHAAAEIEAVWRELYELMREDI